MILRRAFLRAMIPAVVLPGLLVPVVASADSVRVGGTGAITELVRVLSTAFQRQAPGSRVEVVPGLGSRGARRALSTGRVDLALSADPLVPEDRKPGAIAVEWVRTPFVFAVSASMAVSGVTGQDVVEIYGGRRTTWPDGKRLRLILRPAGDSDNALLRGISPALAAAVESALAHQGMIVASTDQEAAEAIASVPGAIGTTTLGLILAERRPLRALSLDGVTPSLAAVAAGTYRHAKTVALISRPDPPAAVRALVEFLRSPAARQIAEPIGYLLVEPR